MYCRYGKFRFGDYMFVWIGILIMLCLVLFAFIANVLPILTIVPISLSVILIFSVLYPYRERFCIDNDKISVTKGKKVEQIYIPADTILIVSYVSFRVMSEGQSYIFKDKYAISFVQQQSLEATLNQLHQNYVKKYTNETIEEDFGYRYLYGFVCDQTILEEVFSYRDYCVIIPESLKSKIMIDKQGSKVYVDVGY